MKMKTEILIVGGGLAGLSAAWQLQNIGAEVRLVEARSRFGGRVCTQARESFADCDLGPSWIWSGQPLVEQLLRHFNIRSYPQYVDGNLLLQRRDASVEAIAGASPMKGSLRIDGGVSSLVDGLAHAIDPASKLLSHQLTGLHASKNGITAELLGPGGSLQCQARQLALVIPPRLAAGLEFSPALPQSCLQALRETPTWMAGHAKFFAIYEKAFWRDQGYCGTAFSECGPLAEIHEATPMSGRSFSLFGFAGIDAHARELLGEAEFTRRALAQLGDIFGEAATHPSKTIFRDWSQQAFTAAAADRVAQTRHPSYGLSLQPGGSWQGRLEFISSESAFDNGGLIEGALQSGFDYAHRRGDGKSATADSTSEPHTASMDWDWL